MIPFEEMPKDNADLANVEIDFPRLAWDSAGSCPEPMSEILSYLSIESADGESLQASDLTFLRTAEIWNEGHYWIWEFTESDGEQCYVTVSESAETGVTCIGFDGNYWNLTPEQFILGTHHNVF